jgi:light-regulated signal transduction histidine kinase (bacteriophytochrome)
MTVADRVQLQQVLMNLMLNGIEVMEESGGVIRVKSQLGEDGQIEISLNDAGPGLGVGKAGQIFDAFLYDEATRQRHGPGNQQVDRRIAWRPDLGQRRRRIWRDIPLHLASGSRAHKPSRRCSVIRH